MIADGTGDTGLLYGVTKVMGIQGRDLFVQARFKLGIS
jgi:hypothetical protein